MKGDLVDMRITNVNRNDIRGTVGTILLLVTRFRMNDVEFD